MKKIIIFMFIFLFSNLTFASNLSEAHYFKIENNEKYLFVIFYGYDVTFSKIEINKCEIKKEKVYSDSEKSVYKIPVIYKNDFRITFYESMNKYYVIKIKGE